MSIKIYWHGIGKEHIGLTIYITTSISWHSLGNMEEIEGNNIVNLGNPSKLKVLAQKAYLSWFNSWNRHISIWSWFGQILRYTGIHLTLKISDFGMHDTLTCGISKRHCHCSSLTSYTFDFSHEEDWNTQRIKVTTLKAKIVPLNFFNKSCQLFILLEFWPLRGLIILTCFDHGNYCV